MITIIILIFILAYFAIATEHVININKAASALVAGVLCWTVYITFSADKQHVSEELTAHLGELSGILFFLLGAMTVVELIDVHDGFNIITDRITQTNKRKLLWIITLLTFFLSPLLDNLTTTIVVVSLVRKLVNSHNDRLLFTGMVVIASNAGGAWSPIGDVTTTMLWIGGQITAMKIITSLFFPGLFSLLVPLMVVSLRLKGNVTRPEVESHTRYSDLPGKQQSIVLISGLLILILVPVFKKLTHLPPYMGILMGLGVLWMITEIMHGNKPDREKNFLSVSYALRKIDTPSILFFLGILLCIAAQESVGALTMAAGRLTSITGNEKIIVLSIGLISSIVDNVPLVAATQGMYSLADYPQDHYFWQFLAYATGTGGSILIIGSAAGVAAMGMERISFFWYLKNISLYALLGYFAGALIFILMHVSV